MDLQIGVCIRIVVAFLTVAVAKAFLMGFECSFRDPDCHACAADVVDILLVGPKPGGILEFAGT